MESMWYVSKNGKALPTTQTKIADEIKLGLLSENDYVFKEGQTNWQKISEYPEFFKSQLKMEFSEDAEESGVKRWVLLVQNVNGNKGYETIGPLNKEQVLEKIQNGEAKWTDYIWKHGFSQWEKVSELSEFNSVAPTTAETLVTLERESKEQLLSHVHVVEKSIAPHSFEIENLKPEEAVGQNLAISPSTNLDLSVGATSTDKTDNDKVKFDVKYKMNTNFIKYDRPSFLNEAKSENLLTKAEPFSPKKIMLYGGTFVGIGLILSISLFISSADKENSMNGSPTADIVETEKSKIHSDQTRKESVAAKKESGLKIVPLKLKGPQPQFAFEGAFTSGKPIQFRMEAKKGQVVGAIRWSYETEIQVVGKEVPTLNLTKAKLPLGSYIVEARVGDVKAKQVVFIGEKNRQFQNELDKYNKKIALQQKMERREIELTLLKVDRLSAQAVQRLSKTKNDKKLWGSYFREWKKDSAALNQGIIAKYRPANSEKFIYPEALFAVSELLKDLGDFGAMLNSSVNSGRKPAATNEVKTLRKKIARAKSLLVH